MTPNDETLSASRRGVLPRSMLVISIVIVLVSGCLCVLTAGWCLSHQFDPPMTPVIAYFSATTAHLLALGLLFSARAGQRRRFGRAIVLAYSLVMGGAATAGFHGLNPDAPTVGMLLVRRSLLAA